MESLNGHDGPIVKDLAAMTLQELMALTIADIANELESSGEEVLVLEGLPLAVEATGGHVKVGLVLTLDMRGDKYLNAVKARMRKEAKRRHDRETNTQLS